MFVHVYIYLVASAYNFFFYMSTSFYYFGVFVHIVKWFLLQFSIILCVLVYIIYNILLSILFNLYTNDLCRVGSIFSYIRTSHIIFNILNCMKNIISMYKTADHTYQTSWITNLVCVWRTDYTYKIVLIIHLVYAWMGGSTYQISETPCLVCALSINDTY